jgi:hypothetical protein
MKYEFRAVGAVWPLASKRETDGKYIVNILYQKWNEGKGEK